MATTTITLTPVTLVAVGTSNAAAGTTRATRDMRGKHGGLLTGRLANGATGPTVQCIARIMVAHDSGTTPAAAAEGAVWKSIYEIGGGAAPNAVTPFSIVVPPCCHLQIEFGNNTGQAVTVESLLTEYAELVTT